MALTVLDSGLIGIRTKMEFGIYSLIILIMVFGVVALPLWFVLIFGIIAGFIMMKMKGVGFPDLPFGR